MIQLNSKQVDRLFKLQTKREVDEFIQKYCAGATWHNLGDRESPAANVEVSPDPINPLIERLVNGMESLIQREVERAITFAKGEVKEPSSIFEAAERFFEIPQGRARNLTINDRRRIAENLKIIFRGKKGAPTVIILDKGIGIHPDDMPNTILSLANSNKGKKPYLIGAYGHGGSSSYEWCDYAIIISRRDLSLLKTKQDVVGWTIVKKSAEFGARTNDYQYLVDETGKVPRFLPAHLNGYDFIRGTYVSHIEMRGTGAFGTELTGLAPYQTLDYRLFDPVFPYLLIEERSEFIGGDTHSGTKEYRGGFSRVLAGLRGRLERLYDNPEKGRRVEFWNKGYTIELNPGSSININFWVIEDLDIDPVTKTRKNKHKDKVRYLKDGGRLSQRPCVATFGGQVHTTLTERVFRDKNLKRVGESTIALIETDHMGDMFRGFFGSNRGEPKEESEKKLQQWLTEALEVHLNELKEIEHQRFEAFLKRRDGQHDIELRKLLDPMIQEFLRGQMIEQKEIAAKRKPLDFKPRQVPTYITFSNPNRTIELSPGNSVNTVVLTNAQDEVLSIAKFELSISDPSLIQANLTSHYSGRWVVRLSALPNAKTNSVCEVKATLVLPGAWICETSKPLRIRIKIPSSPPPYHGSDPPTKLRIITQGGELRLQEGRARVIWIDTDSVDDILTRLTNPATFEITSLPLPITLKGYNQPLHGQIGVTVFTPLGAAPLDPGFFEVKLKLKDGSCLSDKAPIKIVQQSPRGGTINIESNVHAPNYDVVYVSEQPINEDIKSWQDMQGPFGQEWNKEDVAGFDVSFDAQGNLKLWIFINRDFNDFISEQRSWERRGENWIKQMTFLYDAQVAFQCYQASIEKGEPQLTTH
ncbi:MAG: hypothetical protein A2158_07810, partial [Chloroflexi bacterium RBG_13_46_14]